ncbi:hypothetical protein BC939DRAFT_478425 [Gamsiella multidivaricata]|uniref:uncharacterized protein n=1 Tax=Gamsiella multidivaricata TaxID=101098 RepID=UPI00221F3184|nr:uncharacterized protein BC939DRAFT_478425 [Gamsiella multidivaricata]KAI7821190.1 hypothetical protein BC939DRAFT_478425 [Gamsiella multidivaricata]
MTTASESIHFVAAREIIQTALENRINQTAQTSLANAVGLRFSQLDLLSIGQDYVFIIHRDLLLRDIHDYLTGSHMGLQRVFVNIDYHLPQPEIMPNNRYRPLEDYVREVLLPEIETRVSCWAQAEEKFRVLAVPENMSLVTLTGWMLSYPINYIVPKRTFRKSNPQELYHKQGSMKDDYTTAYEEDEDEDEDSGRNCLANQALVVTGVQLEPSEEVEGLGDHLMMSFTYPAKLAERWIDRSVISPEPPCSPFSDDYGQENDEVDSGEDEQFVDASDVEYTESDQDASPHLESKKTIPITNLPKTMTGTCDISNSAEAQLLPPQPQEPTASAKQNMCEHVA